MVGEGVLIERTLVQEHFVILFIIPQNRKLLVFLHLRVERAAIGKRLSVGMPSKEGYTPIDGADRKLEMVLLEKERKNTLVEGVF